MKRKIGISIILLIAFMLGSATVVYAQNVQLPIPKIGIDVGTANSPQEYVNSIQILILLTVLTLVPSFLILMTSFTRIIVVFSFLRNALATQQTPPNQVLVGLALFLTLFIMQPVYTDVINNAVNPYVKGTITQQQAIEIGSKPIKTFMLNQTREKDLTLFFDISHTQEPNDKVKTPFTTLIPAFVISELKTAFQMGFMLYMPFIVIDFIVSSILMAMGMFMLSPAMISLPFKLLLFVMVDGWYLIVKSLVVSFM